MTGSPAQLTELIVVALVVLTTSLTWGAWIVAAIALRRRLDSAASWALGVGLSGALGTIGAIGAVLCISGAGRETGLEWVLFLLWFVGTVAAVLSPFILAYCLYKTLQHMRIVSWMRR